MKKIVAITMAAIMGIGLFSLVGCGNSEDGKTVTFVFKRPMGKRVDDSIAIIVNGEDLTPYGIRASDAPNNQNDKNSPRIKILKNVQNEVFPGVNELEFSISGLSPDDIVMMKMRTNKSTNKNSRDYFNYDDYVSDKVEIKSKKRIIFSEWHRDSSAN